mmetsp:Transcript_14008/g.38278  ORF Transcript_14008/g.38278 Transcript_14008/m.38278 type:complete len:232 (+) Transcript_14008:695-1390(+)
MSSNATSSRSTLETLLTSTEILVACVRKSMPTAMSPSAMSLTLDSPTNRRACVGFASQRKNFDTLEHGRKSMEPMRRPSLWPATCNSTRTSLMSIDSFSANFAKSGGGRPGSLATCTFLVGVIASSAPLTNKLMPRAMIFVGGALPMTALVTTFKTLASILSSSIHPVNHKSALSLIGLRWHLVAWNRPPFKRSPRTCRTSLMAFSTKLATAPPIAIKMRSSESQATRGCA